MPLLQFDTDISVAMLINFFQKSISIEKVTEPFTIKNNYSSQISHYLNSNYFTKEKERKLIKTEERRKKER